MTGRALRWLGLALGMLASPPTEAQSSSGFRVQTVKRPPLRPLKPRVPFQRQPERFEVQSRVSEMTLEGLPEGTLPERKATPAPAVLPPDALDLKLEPATGTQTASGDSMLHLRWSGLGYVVAGLSPTVDHHISTFSLNCQKRTFGAKSKPFSVFWEAIVPTPQGARLIVGESWFDAKECRLAPGPRHELALHTVASVAGKPVLFGAQHGGELLLLGPMLQVHGAPPAGEQVGPAPRHQRGEFSWIHWKPMRGGASLLAGGIHPSSLIDWWKKLGHDPAFPLAPGDPQLQLRLDISQSVSEPRPVGLLTLLQPKRRDVIAQNQRFSFDFLAILARPGPCALSPAFHGVKSVFKSEIGPCWRSTKAQRLAGRSRRGAAPSGARAPRRGWRRRHHGKGIEASVLERDLDGGRGRFGGRADGLRGQAQGVLVQRGWFAPRSGQDPADLGEVRRQVAGTREEVRQLPAVHEGRGRGSVRRVQGGEGPDPPGWVLYPLGQDGLSAGSGGAA